MRFSPSLWRPAGAVGAQGEFLMLDVIMLALGMGAFAAFVGYVALCERL
jgi:hypothetical protein